MRICCVIASLGAGGAERVMTALCSAWGERGDSVTLVTLDDGSSDFYAVPPHVTRVALGVAGISSSALSAIDSNVRRVRELRTAIKRAAPDVVVSFTDRTNVLVLLATGSMPVPVIVSERIDPRYHSIGRSWETLRKLTYRFADAVVVQTRDVVQWAAELVPESRVHAIPNPVRAVTGDVPPASTRPKTVVAVGRLVAQKGFDSLVEAFARTRRRFPDWKLVIHGEGPLRPALEEQVERHSLKTSVSLAGRTADVDGALRDASIFVLSSRYEGFPNALLEACVAGCACISTNCPSGPSELIDDGGSGILLPVDDISALSAALQRLMADEGLRDMLGRNARASIARYSIEAVIAAWDRTFEAVMPARRVVASTTVESPGSDAGRMAA